MITGLHIVVKRFTDIPINRGLNLKKIEPRFGFYRIGYFAIPKLFLYASELLISRKFCQTSIFSQRKNSFTEVKVDYCFCCFFFRWRCHRCLGKIA